MKKKKRKKRKRRLRRRVGERSVANDAYSRESECEAKEQRVRRLWEVEGVAS